MVSDFVRKVEEVAHTPPSPFCAASQNRMTNMGLQQIMHTGSLNPSTEAWSPDVQSGGHSSYSPFGSTDGYGDSCDGAAAMVLSSEEKGYSLMPGISNMSRNTKEMEEYQLMYSPAPPPPPSPHGHVREYGRDAAQESFGFVGNGMSHSGHHSGYMDEQILKQMAYTSQAEEDIISSNDQTKSVLENEYQQLYQSRLRLEQERNQLVQTLGQLQDLLTSQEEVLKEAERLEQKRRV